MVLDDKQITLREVAKRAGVSIKTVSRIVNDDANVSVKTRQKVQQHLTDLNYIPNVAARQMRMGRSSIFGLMTDAIATTPYSVDIVRGAQAALTGSNQTLLIASSDGDPKREAGLWRMFQSHRVAGVVYASYYHRRHDIGDVPLREPVVLANCFAAESDHPAIIPDDEGGGYLQAKYLLQLGHRDIALITLTPEITATPLRGRGVRRAFQEAGLSFDDSNEVHGMTGAARHEVMKAYEVAKSILQRSERPTAIIAGNDQVAMQIYAAAANLGLVIPQDLSIIGYDDLRLISETLVPQLTTVALPYFEIGKKAIELIASAKTQDKAWSPTILVPCPLVERKSCRAIG